MLGGAAGVAVLTVLAGGGAFAIDPDHAANITVYHINPVEFGPIPLNMDVADAAGDLFFDLFEVMAYPIACPNGSATPHSMNCDNLESHGDLVVNQLTLEVDTRFSEYAMCNIGHNGTDGHHHDCKDDTYCCFCGGWNAPPVPCHETVGFENVTEKFSGFHHRCYTTTDQQELAECWSVMSVHKMGGADYYGGWYSPLDVGCADPVNPTENCTWRVVSTNAIINRTCHTEQFFSAVASYNHTCFNECPPVAPGDSKLNDFCNLQCFYQTALSPDIGDPSAEVNMTTGIPTPQLVQAWLSGFRPEAEGGCPRLPNPM